MVDVQQDPSAVGHAICIKEAIARQLLLETVVQCNCRTYNYRVLQFMLPLLLCGGGSGGGVLRLRVCCYIICMRCHATMMRRHMCRLTRPQQMQCWNPHHCEYISARVAGLSLASFLASASTLRVSGIQ